MNGKQITRQRDIRNHIKNHGSRIPLNPFNLTYIHLAGVYKVEYSTPHAWGTGERIKSKGLKMREKSKAGK